MELRTLRYFVAVAQELNITRAAEKLNMSQPPLSIQIRQLEQELGVSLFVRGKRNLRLTEEGSLLLRRASQILDLTDKTCQELASQKEEMAGTIYLGMVEGRAPYLSAQWIRTFQAQYPLVRYSLWNGSGDEVLERLHKGLADLAVIAAPYDNEHLEGFTVGREPWVAILPKAHPLAQRKETYIPLPLLVGQPLIVPTRKSRVEAIHTWFGTIGAQPDILCEMSNYVDAVALAEQGVGISIFPQTTCTPNRLITAKVITQPPRHAEYVLVWNRGQQLSRLSQAFIHHVQAWLETQPQDPLPTGSDFGEESRLL